MSEPTLNEQYDAAFAKLAEVADLYLVSRDEAASSEQLLLLVGMMTAACAEVYNLSPPAGLVDIGSMFTGKIEP